MDISFQTSLEVQEDISFQTFLLSWPLIAPKFINQVRFVGLQHRLDKDCADRLKPMTMDRSVKMMGCICTLTFAQCC